LPAPWATWQHVIGTYESREYSSQSAWA
jgi:hypothetical protein